MLVNQLSHAVSPILISKIDIVFSLISLFFSCSEIQIFERKTCLQLQLAQNINSEMLLTDSFWIQILNCSMRKIFQKLSFKLQSNECFLDLMHVTSNSSKFYSQFFDPKINMITLRLLNQYDIRTILSQYGCKADHIDRL